MKLNRISFLVLAASLALPTLGHAQTDFFFIGPKTASIAPNGVPDGPYLASMNAARTSPFDIFCIDYDNVARSTWTGRILSFTDAVNPLNFVPLQKQVGTAYQSSTSSYVIGAGTEATYLRDLRAAAYLSSQFGATPNGNWAGIHGAIWSLFSQNTVVQFDSWATFRSNALAYVDLHPTDFTGYRLIIDNNAYNPAFNGSLQQAFISNDQTLVIRDIVPEPSTYVLFAIGLAGIGFARRRRNTSV